MRQFVAALLCICMLVTFAACSKKEEESVPQTYEYTFRDLPDPVYHAAAASFAGGTGTEADPYLISNAAEMALLSELTNDESAGSQNAYQSAHYMLTADIVLNDGADASVWATEAPTYSWRAISTTDGFTGTFRGNGHTVSGMYLNADCSDAERYWLSYGLFGRLDGTVDGVNLINSYVCLSGYDHKVGSLSGDVGKNGTVSNCASSAIVECYENDCGGIVGSNDGTVTGCTFTGTVTAKQASSFSNIGGIAGLNQGMLTNCRNEGTIFGGDKGADKVGGVVGFVGDGTVSDCKNSGNVTGGSFQGGIAGSVFLSSIGGEEYQSKGISVTNCENTGTVTGKEWAGGIASWLTNSHSEYTVVISGCTNSGSVICPANAAGIIARYSIEGKGITVENCSNTADIASASVGGIIAEMQAMQGAISVTGCTNTGKITATELYAGGIIAVLYASLDVNIRLAVADCTNEGDIETRAQGGGIIGASIGNLTASLNEDSSVKLSDCTNKAEIYTHAMQGFIGGIVGGWGLKNTSTEISRCVNHGTLRHEDVAPDADTFAIESGRMDLTRMQGGIIGRIGDTLYLSTSQDDGDGQNVNAQQAVIRISDCYSDGLFELPSEDKYLYSSDQKPIIKNHVGGLIGNCSAEGDLSFSVENSGYIHAERGLGNAAYPDVGTMLTEETIRPKIEQIITG